MRVEWSLPAKPPMGDFAIKPPIEPAASPCAPPPGLRNARVHHRRMAPPECLQDRIVLESKEVARQLFGRRRWKIHAMIHGGLLPFFLQHSLRILHPAVMKHPCAGIGEPL